MKTFIYTGLICLGFLIGLFVGHNQGHACKVEQTPQSPIEGLDIDALDYHIRQGYLLVEVFPDGYSSLVYSGPLYGGSVDTTFEVSYFNSTDKISDRIVIYNID